MKLRVARHTNNLNAITSFYIEVLEFPNASLKELSIILNESSASLNLDTFYTSTTSLEGIWTGGDHISQEGKFDPTGLEPGVYEVTYTVGEDSCQQSETR